MTMILMIATVVPPLRRILPEDVEQAIFLGTRNLRRFSRSVGRFEWHLGVLERLDSARRARMESQAMET